jgi:hypothetical protein
LNRGQFVGGSNRNLATGALFLSLSVAAECGASLAIRSNDGSASRHHRRVRRRGLHAHRVLLPAMPRDPAAADELASENLDGTHARSALTATSLR